MDLYFITGLFYVFATIASILSINKKPDFSFWMILNMYFDPGGFLSAVGSRYLGRLDYNDLLILAIVYSILRIKNKRKFIYKNGLFYNFLIYLFCFSVFYFVIYGAVVPYIKNDLNYGTFLLKNRRFIYGIIILIGVYLFSLRGTRQLYRTTLFVALPTILLFWVSVTTPLTFMQYLSFGRYTDIEMLRIGIKSYGLIHILFPISIIVYFLSLNKKSQIENKKLLYFVAMLILASLLISLTRRTIIDVIGTLFIIGFIIAKIKRHSVFTFPIKLVFPFLLLFLTIFFLKPNYINNILTVTHDTFITITTGENSQGEEEKRVTGGGIYQDVFDEIKDNFLVGTGYTYYYWEFNKTLGSTAATSTRGLYFGQMADAAMEIPIVNMLFSFGILGSLLLVPLYLTLWRIMKRNYRLIRLKHNREVSNIYQQLFTILFILMIAKMFTYNIWKTGDEFIGQNLQMSAFFFGLGFALLKTNMTTLRINNNKNEDINFSPTHR